MKGSSSMMEISPQRSGREYALNKDVYSHLKQNRFQSNSVLRTVDSSNMVTRANIASTYGTTPDKSKSSLPQLYDSTPSEYMVSDFKTI